MTQAPIRLTVNGRIHDVTAERQTPLLDKPQRRDGGYQLR